ncbi:Dihydropteroate synthase-like protein [Dimargaris cristalligena]|uniref:Folic acid synthesis protein FOL1 n=1 Tax=Dimargaris cristalligena TaxID=215637 RepID=A0A4P9ZY84_9FUNG|nr:Dihydropteroate synthase-like protein [Dimargaris cristalligena]|eukprot:RKP38705.1 Dihydropteroate synthase-like protein [Dimargaris cristalligena]
MPPLDKVLIRDLTLRTIIGVDSWERIKPQAIVVTIEVETQSIEAAARYDTVSDTVNYGTLCKRITQFSEASTFKSVEALALGILRIGLDHVRSIRATVRIEKPGALLHAAAAGLELTRTREELLTSSSPTVDPDLAHTSTTATAPRLSDRIFVKDLRLSTIVGVNPWERESTQIVVISLELWVHLTTAALASDHVPQQHNYRTIVRTISQYVEKSRFKTVEALASAIARISIQRCQVDNITVRIEKPSALSFAEGAGVEITRTASDYTTPSTPSEDGEQPTATLALGGNVGDTVTTMHSALERLQAHPDIQVTNTSFLYRTAPMYVVDQSRFLNCACHIQTNLTPEALLAALKTIEVDLGRDLEQAQRVRNGPRPIDLDILFYGRLIIQTPDLTIPHPRIQERLFVLFPLCDIARHMEHPTLFKTTHQLLKLRLHAESAAGIERVFPLNGRVWSWEERTYLMGILNCTPDSFSDGGQWVDPSAALTHAQSMVQDGADLIDVGGQSTRPNADEITAEEEIQRVVPVVQLLRKHGVKVPISIDTYYSAVAEAALQAGANFINDVSGGQRDPRILAIAARYQVPICLMHMRGNAKTMMGLNDYPAGQVVPIVTTELQACVHHALRAGIYRWNIIVDPGIGFAKNVDQDLDLLRQLSQLTDDQSPIAGFPVLVGTSRKKFIGKITNQEQPKDRAWGTAATCSAAIAGGCRILRVHDVKEMRDVAKVSDRIWASRSSEDAESTPADQRK